MEIEKSLFQKQELSSLTLQSSADSVITTDLKGLVQYLNPAAERLIGWKNNDAKNRLLSEVFNIIHEFTRDSIENPVLKVVRYGCVFYLPKHTILISRDGSEHFIEDSCAPIRDRKGNIIGAVMVFRDVSKSRELEYQLFWQANHDFLTRLRNRLYFEKKLIEAMVSIEGAIQDATTALSAADFAGYFAKDKRS